MPLKSDGAATDWAETNRWDRGASWLAYPDETMQRASHVLETDAGAIVVDPVDAEGIDDLLTDFGEVAGVIILLNRHKRDSAAVANRHDVPVYVPEALAGVEDDIDAPTERVHRQIPGTDYGIHELTSNALWQEAALYGDKDDTLVVTEALGTADYFLADDERLGVHPALRLTPPTKLNRLSPERLLVGHGHGIMDDASGALSDALRGSRSRTPGLYVKNLKSFVMG